MSRLAQIIFGLLLVLAIAAGGYWAYHSTRPGYRLRRGQDCIRKGDFVQAAQYADLLKESGAEDHYHLLQGEIILRQYNDPVNARGHFPQIKDQGDLGLQAAGFDGECLVLMHRMREAERILRFVTSQRPNHVD